MLTRRIKRDQVNLAHYSSHGLSLGYAIWSTITVIKILNFDMENTAKSLGRI